MQSVQAALVSVAGNAWHLRFRFSGAIDRLRIPAATAPRRADGLWRHLCAELFVMQPDGRYAEFNFSPSGCWAAYLFDSYRSGMRDASLPVDPLVRCIRRADALELEIALTLPVEFASRAALRIALCAMAEEADGTLSCWAVHHAGEQPDFHHAGGFVPLAQ